VRRRPRLALWLLLALPAPAAAQPGGGPADAAPPAGSAVADPGPAAAPAPLAVVDGVVESVDLAAHRVTIDAGGTPVTLALDRNTLVYLPTGLSTVFELRRGELVRAGRNEKAVAFWVQVRSAPDRGGKDHPAVTAPVNEPEPGK